MFKLPWQPKVVWVHRLKGQDWGSGIVFLQEGSTTVGIDLFLLDAVPIFMGIDSKGRAELVKEFLPSLWVVPTVR